MKNLIIRMAFAILALFSLLANDCTATNEWKTYQSPMDTLGQSFQLRVHFATFSGKLNDPKKVSEVFHSLESSLHEQFEALLGQTYGKCRVLDLRNHGEYLSDTSTIFDVELLIGEPITAKELKTKLLLATQNQVDPKKQLTVFSVKKFEQKPSDLSKDHLRQRLMAKFAQIHTSSTVCKNGGIGLPNVTCSCPDYYTGNDCAQQLCQHNGIANWDTSYSCSCPPGFIGRHCETMPCLPSVIESFDFVQRSLIFVVSLRDSMGYDIALIIQKLQQLVAENKDQKFQKYYTNYILTTFYQSRNEKSQIVIFQQTDSFSSVSDFLEALESVIVNPGDVAQPSIASLNEAISTKAQLQPKSDVFLFTDSPDADIKYDFSRNDTSGALEPRVTKALLHWQLSVYVIMTRTKEYGNYGDDYEGVKVFKRLAHVSNGEVINLDVQKNLVGNLLQSLIGYQYLPETIAVRREFDCKTQDILDVDTISTDEIYFYTSGTNVKVLFSVRWRYDPLVPLATYGNNSYFQIFKITSTGKIKIQSDVSSICSYRLFIQSKKSVVVAFASSGKTDASAGYASSRIPHFAVVSPLGVVNPLKTVSYASYPLQNRDSTVLVQESVLLQRADQCNFPLVSSKSVACNPPGPFISKVSVSANSGEVFTRSVISFCYYSSSPNVPTKFCKNGGKKGPDGKCICQKYFTGDLCENSVCINGGSTNPFPGNGQPMCLCQSGFSGDHCELLSCSQSAQKPDLSKRTLAFVLQTSFSQAFLNTEITSAVADLNLRMLQKTNGNYFSKFVLTTFNKVFVNGKSTPQTNTQVFDSFNDLKSATRASELKYKYSTEPRLNALEALNQTLNADVLHPLRSVLFLIVDAPAEDDQKLLKSIEYMALSRSTPINVILSQAYGDDGPGICISGADLDVYRQLATSTGGVLLNLCGGGQTGVAKKFLTEFGAMHFRYELSERHLRKGESGFQSCQKFDQSFTVNDGQSSRFILIHSEKRGDYMATLDYVGNDSKVEKPMLTTLIAAPTLSLWRADNLAPWNANYKLHVTSNNTENCELRIGESSGQSVLLGFSSNPAVDNQGFASKFALPLHPVVFVSTQLQVSAVSSISVSGVNGIYESVSASRQSSCAYDFYFLKNFACKQKDTIFDANIHFSTDEGVSFDRSLRSLCTSPALGECLNGGTFNAQTSKCDCPSQYSGELCELPNCQNGAMVEGNTCACHPGFGGELCETVLCTNWDFLTAYDGSPFEYESVTFVVENSLDAKDTNAGLLDAIDDFIKGIYAEHVRPKQLSLIIFDDNSVQNIVTTAHPPRFIEQFKATLSSLSPPATSSKKSQALRAVGQAAKLALYKPAIVYLFVDGDTDLPVDLDKTIDILNRGGVQVNIFLANKDFKVTPARSAGNYWHYIRTSYSTNGRFLLLSQKNTKSLVQNYLPATVRENALIEDKFVQYCKYNQEVVFPVENRTSWISIALRANLAGDFKTLSLWDGAGKIISDLTPFLKLKDEASILLEIGHDQVANFAGKWKITWSALTGSCHMQVRSSSELDTTVGFTIDQHNDFVDYIPLFVTGNGSTYATVQVTDMLGKNAKVTPNKLDMYTRTIGFVNEKLISTTAMGPRDSATCAHQFITPFLDLKDKLGSVEMDRPLFVKVYGVDETGGDFQRMQIYVPQKIECNNRGVWDMNLGYCICPNDSGYTGIDCDVIQCQNGGTADLSVCNCAPGYYGDRCENAIAG